MTGGARRYLWVLVAAFAAHPGHAQPTAGERQSVTVVRVLARGEPLGESRPRDANPFYTQQLQVAASAILDIPAPAQAALRAQYRLGESDPFVLNEWRAHATGLHSRLIAYIYCASRIRMLRGLFGTCLRDTDGDGRLDAVAVFDELRFPPEGLHFDPVESIPFHLMTATRAPAPERAPYYGGPRLGLAWRFDRDSGRLRFYAQALDTRLRADIDPAVELDPGSLPRAIEIAGAQITVLSWDGHRPTLRLERPFTDLPVRIITPDSFYQIIIGGSRHGWSMEINQDPLPQVPAPSASPTGR